MLFFFFAEETQKVSGWKGIIFKRCVGSFVLAAVAWQHSLVLKLKLCVCEMKRNVCVATMLCPGLCFFMSARKYFGAQPRCFSKNTKKSQRKKSNCFTK